MVIIKGTKNEIKNFIKNYFDCPRNRRESTCSYYYNKYGDEGCQKCIIRNGKDFKVEIIKD